MRIIVNIEHPAHVHFFKNFVWQMRERGHKILISAFNKEVTLQLLEAYDLKYDLCGRQGNSFFASIKQVIERDCRVYRLTKEFKADVIVGVGDIVGAQVSAITGAKSIIFTDTEHAKLGNMLTFPFADVICTPDCFKKELGKKQIRYNGFHELAYLHPNYFKPDPSVLDKLGLKKDDKFVILRFVAWQAAHDIGHYGLDMEAKKELIRELKEYARVLITSESPLPKDFEEYRLLVPPENLHDVLYYASLCISEGGTTATECAILGTPTIHISTTAQYCGNFDDLQMNYDLMYTYSDQQQALQKAIEIIRNTNSKREWQNKRKQLLSDKIDVTKFMIDFVENYFD